jgi:hypothetical protein
VLTVKFEVNDIILLWKGDCSQSVQRPKFNFSIFKLFKKNSLVRIEMGTFKINRTRRFLRSLAWILLCLYFDDFIGHLLLGGARQILDLMSLNYNSARDSMPRS